MQTAGARPLREDEQQMSRTGLSLVEPEDREAVLLQWERKIEQEERSSRFARDDEEAVDEAGPSSAPRPVATPPSAEADASPQPAPVPERRTVTISGRPDPQPLPRRRQSVALRHISAQPDRLALWAFLLGLFLLAVAFGTAHA
jgi:hypothetical protein